jgi:hypothetical protein
MINDDPSSADPLGPIADEFVEAFRRGQRPSVEEFARRYPEHADEIRDMLPALALMEKAKAADDSSAQRRQANASAAVPLRQLGDYQLLREVGRGGMGVVYEAQQLSLGRHVAIKVLPSHALLDPRQLGRFQREARSAARLHHTNIVPVFGVGEQDGLHYYVMQFIPGLGLDVVLDELRRLRRPREKQAPTQAEAPGRPTGGTRDVSAVAVARGLLSGEFHKPEPAGALTTAPAEPSPVAPGPGGPEAPSSARAADTSATIHLPGQTEASALSESGNQYWHSVARVGVQVADALAHAAGQGVLHRDIKPSNLLLDDTGNVWVTDFGLAKAATDGDDLTHTGDVVLLPIAPGEPRIVLGRHGEARATALAFSPDGTRLAAAFYQNPTVVLWDVAKREQLGSLRGHREQVLDVAFSPDGEWIATGGLDYTARIWEARTGQNVATLSGSSSPAFSVRWSPRGDCLAAGMHNSREVFL